MGLLDGGIRDIVGNALTGVFLDFTLIQVSKTKAKPWEATDNVETETRIKAINASFKYHEIDGTNIKQTDRKVIILAKDLSVVPKVGDMLQQDGESDRYQIISPVLKDAAGATYTCHCR